MLGKDIAEGRDDLVQARGGISMALVGAEFADMHSSVIIERFNRTAGFRL